jgi:hypothetical protein
MVSAATTSRTSLTYDSQLVFVGWLGVDGRLGRNYAGVGARSLEVHVPEQNLSLVANVPLQHNNANRYFQKLLQMI